MDRVVSAFLSACLSQLHPRMLTLLALPFVLALVGWVVAAWWLWEPLTGALSAGLAAWMADPAWAGWAKALRLDLVGAWLSGALGLIVLVPLMVMLGIVVVAVFAMPIVNRYLADHGYGDVVRQGGWSLGASLRVAAGGFAVFALGYLLTLPLWLIPGLGLLVPWFWWSWLTARLLSFDSLVEHASDAEREALLAQHRRAYLGLGLLVSLLNYIPPLFLVTPVLSALAFGHYSLRALRVLRRGEGASRVVLPHGGIQRLDRRT